MAKSTIEVRKDQQVIHLDAAGDLNVQQAKQLKARLLEILAEPLETHLALDKVVSLDTTAVQLIFLFKQEMKKRSLPVKVSPPGDTKVLSLLEKTGITKLL